MQFIWLEIVV